jgi:L,D-transpeptidase ErfK/SrfK
MERGRFLSVAWQVWGVIIGLYLFLPSLARAWDEEVFFSQKRLIAYSFVLPQGRNDLEVQTVIGAPREYIVQPKDTLLDIARYFGLGYNEIIGAHPKMDPWLPPVGEVMMIPTFWVLPKSGYEGIVVNIPEMRLYYFPPLEKRLSNRVVITLPVGLGREDWPTPRAKFKVRGKTVNPTWVLPESIRKERIQEKGWSETMIPGGSPDNPLGKYRFELAFPAAVGAYAIHGTNNPWAVGRLVTHGCIRLYPEDIEQFFDVVRVGSPGEFVYQPVKIGMLYGKVYIEVHEDIYNLIPDMWGEAQRVVRESGWENIVDRSLLRKALMEKSGVPLDVTNVGYEERRNERVDATLWSEEDGGN